MKIAYITTYNAQLLTHDTWRSGYFMAKYLKKINTSLEYIGSLKERYPALWKLKRLFYRHACNKIYLRDREPCILKHYKDQIVKRLMHSAPDIILSPGTIPLAYLECAQPMVFWTDSSFAGIVDFFPSFSNVCDESLKHGHAIEQSVLDKCRLAIFSSNWAANKAMAYYKVDREKVKVISFGATVYPEKGPEEIDGIIKNRSKKTCNLIFIGVDWKRKGGDIAVAVTRLLNQSGLSTRLSIIGCQPKINENDKNYVKILGYVDTATKQGLRVISSVLAQSHFLILPTKADCSPNVLRDAYAFGVPCLTTSIAGIPEEIKNNINGYLFPTCAEVDDYCDYITKVHIDRPRYVALAKSSFEQYQKYLNWPRAAQKAMEYMADI